METLKKVLLMIVLCLFALPVVAQDSFEEWQRQRQEQFQQFKDERDAKFLEMLEQVWEEVESMRPASSYEEPKFDEIPEAPERPRVREERPEAPRVVVNIDIPDIPFEAPAPIEMPAPAFEAPAGAIQASMDYYDVNLDYYYFEDQRVRMRGMPNEDGIRKFWTDMSKTDYEPILARLDEVRKELSLNDWGYMTAVYKMGQDIYGTSDNSVVLFTWYMLTKSGYKAKIGYSNTNVYLLLPAESRIYNIPFYTIDGERHYAISFDGTVHNPQRMKSYEGSYPEANALVSLYIPNTPDVTKSMMERELSFRYGPDVYEFTVPVNRNLIAYYEFYPHTDLDIYHTAARSESTRNALLKNLGEIIDGKDQVEAANILMRFTQTAFKYKTDTEQFNRQKYMLPEETVFYPYSDCDDRAIMFAFLVDELLGLEVVGLLYPRHLATAVKFDQHPEGDYVMVGNQQYTVADPTYILSDIGMTMPQFEGVTPEVISMK